MAAVDAGWSVIGVDNFEAKVAQINGGSSPVEDISDVQLQAAISKRAYRATTDFSAVSEASVITICVPTPLDEKREPDLALLRSAATGIAPYVSDETLVVSESTSYPGTLREIIIPIINQLKPKDSSRVYFASAPERVNPGDPVWNQKNTPRLVGSIDKESQQRALAFYESICDAAVSVSNPEVAEAAKLLENTFRLVNIALINEFTQLCSASGINVYEVIDAMPKYVAERALSMVGANIKNPKVLILGVAYKPGVGDVRETPVSELRDYLKAQGAEVAWHDPLVPAWEGSNPVDLEWHCDVAILATRQPGMYLEHLIGRGIQILDCTNSITGQTGVSSL